MILLFKAAVTTLSVAGAGTVLTVCTTPGILLKER